MNLICTVDGCAKKRNAAGLCSMHYRRLRVHGDVNFSHRPNYGSGRLTKGKRGYVRVRRPGHLLADSVGYAYEHRLVAYEAGLLTDLTDQVHHINEDRADNRLENLEVTPQREHLLHHFHKNGVSNQYGVWPLRSDRR